MILFRYIVKNHAAPFVFSLFTLIAVFLLQFMMKFADKLVGKGLSTWIIFKLVAYSLGWMFVLAVPMAVLVATLMAFGSMAQNNEIAIIKSSGISLYKMLIPPLLAGALVTFLLIQFNNYIYPNTNHALRLLQQDISNKKPTLSLVPGVFSQEVPNYAILAREIDQEKNELKNLTIYDYSNSSTVNIVTAKSGKIYFSNDQSKLILDLHNGEIHESKTSDFQAYRRLEFEKHKIAMPADQFSFQQSEPGGPRGDRELGAQDMVVIVDSLKKIRDGYVNEFNTTLANYFIKDTVTNSKKDTLMAKNKDRIFLKVSERLHGARGTITAALQRLEFSKDEINRFEVEINKRYSIPFACIVFILIGAPLGTMTRKGGFGVAAGISLFFFLIYWAFLIGGEKLADRALLSPFWGMWTANFVLGALGIFLLIKSAREQVTISFNFLSKLSPKGWRVSADNDQNS